MEQVIIAGRLERIDVKDSFADLVCSCAHSILTIRTREGRVAKVRFCSPDVPKSYRGRDVLYVGDYVRGQQLMTGKLLVDKNHVGIKLRRPRIFGIPLPISPVITVADPAFEFGNVSYG